MQGTGGTTSSGGSDGLPRMPPGRPRRLSGVGRKSGAVTKAERPDQGRGYHPSDDQGRKPAEHYRPAATFRKPEHSTFPKHTRPIFQPKSTAKNVDVHDPMRWTSAFLDHTRNAFDAPVVFSGPDRDAVLDFGRGGAALWTGGRSEQLFYPGGFEGGGAARPITAPHTPGGRPSLSRGSGRGLRPPSPGVSGRPASANMQMGGHPGGERRFPAGAYPAHGGPYDGWQGTRGFLAGSRPPLPWERGRQTGPTGEIQLPAPWRPEG